MATVILDSTGIGIGATLTWYGSNGLYVDDQAQEMFFDSDLNSETEGHQVISGNKGHGFVRIGKKCVSERSK